MKDIKRYKIFSNFSAYGAPGQKSCDVEEPRSANSLFTVWIDGAEHVIDEISFSDTDQYSPWGVSCECCSVEGDGSTFEAAVRDFVDKVKKRKQDEY